MPTLKLTPEERIFTDNEGAISFPGTIGQGGIRMMRFRTGIRLFISDYRLHSDTVMDYVAFPGVFGFGFCLSGDISNQPTGFKHCDDIHSGQNALFHFQGDGMREAIGTRRVIRLNVMLEPELMQSLFQNAPDEVLPILQEVSHHPRRLFGSLTTAMRDTILQILNCPYQGLTRAFYLESKVLELVAYKLDQLGDKTLRTADRRGLTDEDLGRAEYAGQLMARELETPPCLSELAHRVGMCQNKLCRCFREVYGMTPFDYLRSKRLETAEQLLRLGQMNVTQVAFSVGYSSLSHFTKAFRQHTGLLPSQCRGKGGPADRNRGP
jgi:AraC-like DNA-binding protein